jgi:hypothetical protein
VPAESTAADALPDTEPASDQNPPSSTIVTIGDTAAVPPQLLGPDQLVVFARQERTSDESPVTKVGCNYGAGEIIAEAFYNGTLVLVVDDASTGRVLAVDQATCDVIETVTP